MADRPQSGAPPEDAGKPEVETVAARPPRRGDALLVGSATDEDHPSNPAIEETQLAPTPGPPSSRSSGLSGVSSTDTDRWLGKTLAQRYTLLERIGRGGMSVVYLARHELLHKMVAIKLLREDVPDTEESRARFHREAMAAAGIGHPHVVDITDYGFTDDGTAFIVMERLEGVDLRRAIRDQGAFGAARAVAITRQILGALAAAHGKGVIHRDLKAENVFLCPREGQQEQVKLLDFGISKLTRPGGGSDSSWITSTGIVMGTPQYIAPEQAHGHRDIDHRVDIYSLGVILYEMLTGQLPFSGESALDVVMKHVQDAPEPPRKRRPDLAIPRELERVVLKAMRKDRDQRYASAKEMLAALPAAEQVTGNTVAQRGRGAVWTGLALVALAVAAAGFLLWPRTDEHGLAAIVDAGAEPLVVATEDLGEGTDARLDLERGGLAPDLRATVVLRLEVVPSQATVYLGDEVLGSGRGTEVALPRSREPVLLTVRAPGYRGREIRVVPDRDRPLRVRLRRLPPSRPEPEKEDDSHPGPSDLHDNPYRKRAR